MIIDKLLGFSLDPTLFFNNYITGKRARSKGLGLAYVKHGTSGRWIGTRTGAGVTSPL